MKYMLILLCMGLACPAFAHSSTLQNMTDAQQLGTWAGLALACNAGNKLDDFEFIASRIIGNQETTDKDRTKAFTEYASEKLQAYNLQRKNPTDPCSQILAHFDELPIFRSIVYDDGSVKLPDGKILPATPQQPQSKRIYMQPPTN